MIFSLNMGCDINPPTHAFNRVTGLPIQCVELSLCHIATFFFHSSLFLIMSSIPTQCFIFPQSHTQFPGPTLFLAPSVCILLLPSSEFSFLCYFSFLPIFQDPVLYLSALPNGLYLDLKFLLPKCCWKQICPRIDQMRSSGYYRRITEG